VRAIRKVSYAQSECQTGVSKKTEGEGGRKEMLCGKGKIGLACPLVKKGVAGISPDGAGKRGKRKTALLRGPGSTSSGKGFYQIWERQRKKNGKVCKKSV